MPSLGGCSALFYGPPKIGKSTFCSGLDNVVFADTEGGLRFCVDKGRILTITSWKDFQQMVKVFLEDGHVEVNNGDKINPAHIVIDTLDVLWVYCTEYICRKHGFEHPSDESYGKGYQVLRYEFQKYLARLNSSKAAMVLISHSKSQEVRGRGANRTSRVVPSIPNSAREVILPMVDVIGYCGFDVVDDSVSAERAILFSPEEGLEAGDRSGRLPKAMALNTRELDKYFGKDAGKVKGVRKRGAGGSRCRGRTSSKGD